MRNFILIISSIFLFACSTQKNNLQTKEKKEGRKIYGVVSQEYLGAATSQAKSVQKPQLSLKVDNEYYYIKIANPSISEKTFSSMVGKSIEVKGELVGEGFGGEIIEGAPLIKGGGAEAATQIEIGHILIFEILEEEN